MRSMLSDTRSPGQPLKVSVLAIATRIRAMLGFDYIYRRIFTMDCFIR